MYIASQVVKDYGNYGLERVKKIALNHMEIDCEVEMEKQNNMEVLMESDLHNGLWEAMPEMDHEIRTRKEMVVFIATLELIAGSLRDEIADGCYVDDKGFEGPEFPGSKAL